MKPEDVRKLVEQPDAPKPPLTYVVPPSQYARLRDSGVTAPMMVSQPIRVWMLTCVKTGRFWRYASEGQCRNAARALGLKDYTIEKEAGS